jgi:signal transduction histidine kinase
MSQIPPTPREKIFSSRFVPLRPDQLTDPELIQAVLENQSLKDQIATQTQFMQLLTHQLATPLTALRGSVQLLAEPELNLEQQREFLQVVQEQVQRLHKLLQDVVALRNLETGTLERHTVSFCVKALVEEVMAGFAPYPVIYQFGPDLRNVWGDPWQVSQVLVNLVSNAIKYSTSGSPIQVGADLLPTGWVEVWVRDRGLGIPADAQAQLFERFYRVKHRDRAHIDGTGLGLSLCKLLVENQGGQIEFDSAHGEGSRFFFTLPTVKNCDR